MKKIILFMMLFACTEVEHPVLSVIHRHRDDLRWSEDLYDLAYLHAHYMDSVSYGHVWEDGTTLRDRAEMVGVSGNLAENIARGQSRLEDVMASWMSSPCHRANIMNRNYKYVAIAEIDRNWVMVLSN